VRANHILRDLKEEHFSCQKLTTRKMSGTGNGRCKLISFEHAIELIMVLPGDNAKEYRHKFADIIKRYLAGDATLISEIQANAASDHPVNRMAREACAADAEQVTDVSLKRKREALELRKMELDMHMTIMDRYEAVCKSETLDLHAKDVFRTMLLNEAGQGAVITGGADTTPISLSQMGARLGYKLSTDEYKRVGKITGKLYREAHGVAPPKHTQLVNGQAVEVNTYFAKDGELVKRAFELYAQETSAPAGPGIDKFFPPKTAA